MKQLILLLIFSTAGLTLFAQQDKTLFTVNGKAVPVSEFDYIYSKTNGDKADYSKASLDEYLDLYVKFKLKVQRALDMKLDTIPSLQKELDGYRQQLANSYLIDKEVTERLIKEAYDRSLEDVKLSHILVKLTKNAPAADSTKAIKKLNDLKKRIEAGESFEDLAKQHSNDGNSRANGGKLGYITAMLPNGFYALENAAYANKNGDLVGPLWSPLGCHLLRVEDRRPARGEMEVAHILIRNDKTPKGIKAKTKIDSIYQALQKGADFEKLAEQHSDDKVTASKKGYLGRFGINRYELTFEESAFGLKKDGDISKPVRSSIGWHVIKRISRPAALPYDQMRRNLQNKIAKDGRYEIAKKSLIERIKKTAGIEIKKYVLEDFIKAQDETFLTYKWKAPYPKSTTEILTVGSESSFNLGQFTDFLIRNSRKRAQRGKKANVRKVINILFEEFVDESVLKHEESQLTKKYPDFKNLMREYEEGIMLFEATKIMVWDKASKDTVGLKEFYARNESNYKWNKRATVETMTVQSTDAKLIKKILKKWKSKSTSEVIEKFDTEKKMIRFEKKKYELTKDKLPEDLSWESGSIGKPDIDPAKKTTVVSKVTTILPAGPKKLNEAKGYVVADYQDELEKAWIEELRSDYKVDVNKDVFNSLIKK